MSYIELLEYLGVFAFAVSGAIVAMEEKYDVFGIYMLAAVTAMGGGVIRDIVTDVQVPVFFTNYIPIIFIFLGATFAMMLRGQLKYKLLFTTIDALGLGAFFVSAGMRSIQNDYNFSLFLFAATITGVGGGVLRDILTKRKPQIFQYDVYCVAGILGAILLWILYPVVGVEIGQFLALISIVVVRMVCYIRGIDLPKVAKQEL